jgi:integrase
VLTLDDVHAIIQATRTPWNRVYFWTVYSCGLRLHEALHLEISDVDGQRRMLHVHRGKGAKDRYVPLPESTLSMLREFWKMHRNPRWLFPAATVPRAPLAPDYHGLPAPDEEGSRRVVSSDRSAHAPAGERGGVA